VELLGQSHTATVHVINSGTSKSPAMMAELRKLYALLDRHRITLKVEYIM